MYTFNCSLIYDASIFAISLPATNCAATPAITIGSYSFSNPIEVKVVSSSVIATNFFL